MRGNTRGENRSWSGMPAPQIIGRTAALLRQEGQFVTAVLNALSALPGRYVQYLPMRQNIREGESLAAPLKRGGLIPPLATHMIAVGEKSGDLEAMLIRVSQVYDSEVETSMNQLTALLEPLMIVIMGVVVLFIILAILLPIFEMSQMAR